MYNNGRTNVLDREEEKTQSKFDSDRIFGIRDDADDETVLVRKSGMTAETPVKDKESSRTMRTIFLRKFPLTR